jgi:uncharacterized YigZ family protein
MSSNQLLSLSNKKRIIPLKPSETTSDSFDIPAEEVQVNHTAANSRFIARLAPVFDVAEARAYLDTIRNKFPDASHHVPAYIIGGGKTIIEYCSDDGEPSGTAGRPVLAVLRGSSMGNVILVVTRYFGGTLLGKGGLVKAYTESAQLAVKSVSRARKQLFFIAEMTLPYNKLDQIRSLVASRHGKIKSEDFSEVVRMVMMIPGDGFSSFEATIRELSAGKINPVVISSADILVPVDK